MTSPNCICGEINARNCPVHQGNEGKMEARKEYWLTQCEAVTMISDGTNFIPVESTRTIEVSRLGPVHFEKKDNTLHVVDFESYKSLQQQLKIAVDALEKLAEDTASENCLVAAYALDEIKELKGE